MKSRSSLPTGDLAIDEELAEIAEDFDFLLDLTPVNLADARRHFEVDGCAPRFEYRPLEDDCDVVAVRLAEVAVDSVEDPTLASLLLGKQRELRLQLEMLACRDTDGFLPLSIELYGAASPKLLEEAEAILSSVAPPGPEPGEWLDVGEFVAAARAELDHYLDQVPHLDNTVQIREGSSGVMVSNGDLLVAPTVRIAGARLQALLQHEIGTHVVTHVNGSHQPLRVLASGLAGHDETQEGLAVLAEYLVGGLSAGRLRELAARVVAVCEMVNGAEFPDVHRDLVDVGVPPHQAFGITMRVFRSGGLTKDAIYLRGLRELVEHVVRGGDVDVLMLGKMPLTAVPLVAELHDRGALNDPLLRPRYLDDPQARTRLTDLTRVSSLTELIGAGP